MPCVRTNVCLSKLGFFFHHFQPNLDIKLNASVRGRRLCLRAVDAAAALFFFFSLLPTNKIAISEKSVCDFVEGWTNGAIVEIVQDIQNHMVSHEAIDD